MTTFPTHRTKINRAMALAEIGSSKASAEAMLRVIPESVIAKISGQELAQLLDAMWRLSQNSKDLAETEAVSDGRVWDSKKQSFRELA